MKVTGPDGPEHAKMDRFAAWKTTGLFLGLVFLSNGVFAVFDN
jgi:hypothetical protein